MVLTDENKDLDDECKSQLTKRMEMFKSAAVVNDIYISDIYKCLIGSNVENNQCYFIFSVNSS